MSHLLVRTCVAETKSDLERLVAQEQEKGWSPIGNPNRLLVSGLPAEGRAQWFWAMERRV